MRPKFESAGWNEMFQHPSIRCVACSLIFPENYSAWTNHVKEKHELADELKMAEAPTALPQKAEERKGVPLASGLLDYFTSALAEVARVSKAGNDQHNPGQPLHWARGKSTDHADCIMRHLAERGTVDTDGMRHSAKMAWRALALLQTELEAAGAPVSRGSK